MEETFVFFPRLHFSNEEHPLHLSQHAHLVSLTVDRIPQLCRGEEHPQVVIQNGLLPNTTQSKVL